MVLRKCFYIRWSAGRSPQVHEVNPGRNPSPSGGNPVSLAFSSSSSYKIHMLVIIY